MTDLRMFDLNLLIALDALMAERNVTRAAQRVGIGQPAMSYALARLRELFGDDLFIRTTTGMQPTTRALELAGPVARILGEIRESVLADRAFRPHAAQLVFRVGTSDYLEAAMFPAVLGALQSAAPKARVAISSVDRDRVGALLESGAIDLAIGHFSASDSAQKSEILYHDEFVCLFDAKACGVSPPLDLKTYLELPHLLMSPRGDMSGSLDTPLARSRSKRHILMATPHFLTFPFLLHGFRGVAAVPRVLAWHCVKIAGLSVSPLPVPTNGFDISILWHSRTETDPAQRWFRDLVREAGRSKAVQLDSSRSGRRQRTIPSGSRA